MERRSDFELIGAFVRGGDHRAFAELVHRHVDLVYTAARRQVRDPHLAEDVTQTVFLALFRKAAFIKSNVVLEGWLLSATRYAAQDALRSGGRRARHETAAAQNRSQHVQPDPPASSAAERQETLGQLDSLLDAALARLTASTRDAVVLRFFQNKSFNEVGRELGIGEQAAKQRVFRGLRQLRGILSQSGLDVPLEALGTVLGAQGILPAPAGLAHAIIAASAKAGMTAAGTASVTKGALTIMAWTKAKIAATAAVGLLLLSGSAAVVHHYATGGTQAVVITPGTLPPTGARSAAVSWGLPRATAEAYSGPPITGTVVDAAGKPVADAEVLVSSATAAISVYQWTRMRAPQPLSTKTSADGQFKLAMTDKPLALVVRCAAGYGSALVEDPAKPISIRIEPWARLEGVVRNGSKPVPHAKLEVVQTGNQANWERSRIDKSQQIETDENGHFLVEHMAPGRTTIARNWSVGRNYHADLVAGKTTIVNIGGDGRKIIGRVPALVRGMSCFGSIQVPQPQMTKPANWDQLDEVERQKLQQAFWRTPEFENWRQTANIGQFDAKRDGTFEVENVPPGTYTISLQAGDPSPGNRFVETAGWAEKSVTVPPLTADLLDVPLDVGQVDLTMVKRMAIGDPAPEIAGDSLDGSSARLSDFRGKYVVLHLWASDRIDTLQMLPMLDALRDRFRDDPQFAIVGLNLDTAKESARNAMADHHMQWPQILLHGWEDHRLPREYTYSPAMLFLIDPEGRLVAKNVDVPAIFGILQRVRPAQSTANVHVERQPEGQEKSWAVTGGEDNIARSAEFSLVDGQVQSGGGSLNRLHDGLLPNNSDAANENFYFAGGTLEGRFKIDLGSVASIAQIKTYSWHKSSRGPQVYRLYAAAGDAPNFNPNPKIGIDPLACGWTQVALVDTRPPAKPEGGRYVVEIGDAATPLGKYRYLLFETFVTETSDLWGHTFYSEVEVNGSR